MWKEGLSDLNTHIFKTFRNNFQMLTPVWCEIPLFPDEYVLLLSFGEFCFIFTFSPTYIAVLFCFHSHICKFQLSFSIFNPDRWLSQVLVGLLKHCISLSCTVWESL